MKSANKKITCKLIGFMFLLLICELAFGLGPKPTLGSIAEELIAGSGVVTRLLHFVSIMVGIVLFIMAGSLYKAHRFNPKLVPLDRPVIYVVLGIILILIPFLGDIFGSTGSAQDIKKREAERKGVQMQDIDAPLEGWGNDYDH